MRLNDSAVLTETPKHIVITRVKNVAFKPLREIDLDLDKELIEGSTAICLYNG